ncbi:hypothetical protein GLYMA_08G305701v4 [Glycine max]|nr:hypothetical protein GLYMA_08G305701v4 [Glycine max]KAH1053926.1 hypothetical protein GYH30_022929 [Glycine max]
MISLVLGTHLIFIAHLVPEYETVVCFWSQMITSFMSEDLE